MQHSTAVVTINDTSVTPVVVRNQPVLTLAMIDQIHERAEGTARRNFAEHKARLTDGEDYFVVTRESPMDEIRALGAVPPKGVTVLTESGYLLLVKSFTDDLAWAVQKQIVSGYFRAKAGTAEIQQPAPAAVLVDLARLTLEHLPNLGDNAKQSLLSVVTQAALGVQVIPLPVVREHHMSATEVGEQLGISAVKVGRLANQHGLKTAEFGETRLDKSRHSTKQVETFVYNRAGLDRLREILELNT